MLKLRKALTRPALWLAAWLDRAASAPIVSFEVSPPNPVAGQTVQPRDTTDERAS
jgi:hypothetical protein